MRSLRVQKRYTENRDQAPIAVRTCKSAARAFAQMKVCLVYSPAPRQVHECLVDLADGCTVTDAVHASELPAQYPEILSASVMFGVWGKRVTTDHVLRDQDRLEVYRELRVDPKVARRERFKSQGAKSAGLFSSVRAGAKAGY